MNIFKNYIQNHLWLRKLCWKKLDFAIMKRKFINSMCERLVTPITKELRTIVVEMALGKTLRANSVVIEFYR